MVFLVTGGAGFIGSNFTKKALDLGHEVLVLDNLSTGKKENLDPRAGFAEVDLCDFEKMKPYFSGIDYVFHFAALPRVPLSIEKPRETNRNNVESTLNVLIASKDAGVKRVIYSSSSSAYGRQAIMPLKEDMLPAPINPYAVQKYIGEHYVRVFYDLFGLEGVCLRYFNVYGPSMAFDGAYATAIACFIEQKKANEPLTIYGDGEQTRDFVYVNDVAEANFLAAFNPDISRGEVINIGSGINYSINKIADIVGGKRIYAEERKGDIRHSLADIEKARKLLGWEPKTLLEEGIKKLI